MTVGPYQRAGVNAALMAAKAALFAARGEGAQSADGHCDALVGRCLDSGLDGWP